MKFLKKQRRLFRNSSRELTRAEYETLLKKAAALGCERLALLMETICATGIRVSEVRYITVEEAKQGKTVMSMKGKIRAIMLPSKLCRKLLKYSKKQDVAIGAIFITGNGKEVSRRQIWSELKELCKHTSVSPSKVIPHNLRHLFAGMFYKICKYIA